MGVRLTVIVVIVDGGAQLDRCLSALATQTDPGDLEVVVPWDDTVAGMANVAARYPQMRFPAIGHIQLEHPASSHAGLHELYDKRRTVGLHEATGELVGMVEDRSVPRHDWVASARRLHRELPNGVIGGAMESGRDSLAGHADYLCDFYRFQPPLVAGPRDYVSYVNLCYKREVLERTRDLWKQSYYDLTVHRAVQDAGEELWLSPDLLVRQERGDGTRLGTLLGERFAWGCRFAQHRIAADSSGRLRFALQSPLVPLILWLRAMRAQPGKPARLRALLASPLVLLIFGAWGLGEFVGSVRGSN